jgi:hypothetical protein
MQAGPAARTAAGTAATADAPPAADRPAAAASRTAAPAAAAPRATSGTLVVRSTPSGAGVTVNGRWRGRTPLTLPKLPFASYEVRVVREGYTAAREAVTLSADEPARDVTVRLQQVPPRAPAAGRRAGRSAAPAARQPERYSGSIFVDSRPRGARVTVDGKPVGVTPLTLADVSIGSHIVRLELPDHRIWSTMTTVRAGEQARVTGSLERIE